jgi:hypothetical protein
MNPVARNIQTDAVALTQGLRSVNKKAFQKESFLRVDDGARTHDPRYHKPML